MAREIGDIENDIGFVVAQIYDLETQLEELRQERDKLELELECAADSVQ